ncbi:hypothetical protein D1007_31540 [Hordeum vulgare]|nr:hypothetical protein D1007_31540 [Hordeum vulgare]
MMAMVVQEFIYRRIAPLQRYSLPMWPYAGPRDPMRIQVLPLSLDVLCKLLRQLTGDDPNELPLTGLPLYNFKASEALLAGMPLFDESRSSVSSLTPEAGSRLGISTASEGS